MTVNEIVDQLRATRPSASDALRLQVLTLASTPPPPAPPTLLDRVRARRRLALALPAAVTLAAVSAVAIGVSRSDPVAREATTPPATVESSTGSPDRTTLAGPASDTAGATAQKAAMRAARKR